MAKKTIELMFHKSEGDLDQVINFVIKRARLIKNIHIKHEESSIIFKIKEL